MVPAAEDLQQPLEAQGRGFAHGHSKGHSRVGVGIRWVRTTLRQQGGNLVEAVKRLRSRLLCTAATVQYESAREPGLQLGVSVMPEPFTALQQKQSRMDGGIEDDGSRRDLVPVEPAFVQPHIAAEQRKACAEGREARAGTLAFKEVPLTGAIQSIFPAYRQRASFCDVFSAPEPDACAVACRSLHELFEVDEEGKVFVRQESERRDSHRGGDQRRRSGVGEGVCRGCVRPQRRESRARLRRDMHQVPEEETGSPGVLAENALSDLPVWVLSSPLHQALGRRRDAAETCPPTREALGDGAIRGDQRRTQRSVSMQGQAGAALSQRHQ